MGERRQIPQGAESDHTLHPLDDRELLGANHTLELANIFQRLLQKNPSHKKASVRFFIMERILFLFQCSQGENIPVGCCVP